MQLPTNYKLATSSPWQSAPWTARTCSTSPWSWPTGSGCWPSSRGRRGVQTTWWAPWEVLLLSSPAKTWNRDVSVLRVLPHVAGSLRCCSLPPSHWQAALKPGCQRLLSAANFRNPTLLFFLFFFSELRPTSGDKTLKMQQFSSCRWVLDQGLLFFSEIDILHCTKSKIGHSWSLLDCFLLEIPIIPGLLDRTASL